MKKIITLLFCFGANSILASNIEWGLGQIVESIPGTERRWNYNCARSHEMLYAMLDFCVQSTGESYVLLALGDFHSTYDDVWVKSMSCGDVVDEHSIFNEKRYFYGAGLGSKDFQIDYDIVIPRSADSMVYLGFATSYAKVNYQEYSFELVRVYGWAEFYIADDLTPTMVNSAWDLDGGPVTVGAIPEPSSATLLTFGLALLGLRRRKANGMIPS